MCDVAHLHTVVCYESMRRSLYQLCITISVMQASCQLLWPTLLGIAISTAAATNHHSPAYTHSCTAMTTTSVMSAVTTSSAAVTNTATEQGHARQGTTLQGMAHAQCVRVGKQQHQQYVLALLCCCA
jgi:hypothetical protein